MTLSESADGPRGRCALALLLALAPTAAGIDFEVTLACAGMPWSHHAAPPIATSGEFFQFDLPSDFPPSHVVAALMPELMYDSYVGLDGGNLDGLAAPTLDDYTSPMPALGDASFAPWLASFSVTNLFEDAGAPLTTSLRQGVGGVEADMVFVGRFTVMGGDGTIDIAGIEVGLRPLGFESDPVLVLLMPGLGNAVELFGSDFFIHVHQHESPFGTVNDVYIAADGVPTEPQDCAEDVNADGVVNVIDLNAVLYAFGCQGLSCDGADLNLDGAVDSGDVNMILFAFGTPCK